MGPHSLSTIAASKGGWGQAVQDRARELEIATVTPIPVVVPRTEQAGQYWMFVKLSTNKKDLVGYGELYTLGIPFEARTVAAMVRDFGENVAVGTNPYHIESLFQRGYAYHYTHHADFVRLGLLSAIEMACWDIVGKDLNKPVYELLGGPVRSGIRTYTYINDNVPPSDRKSPLWHDPKATADRAKYYTSLGFNAVKLDPVQGASKEISEYEMLYPIEESLEALDRSEQVVGAVRQAVGSKCDVLIGTHGQFTVAGAVAFAKRLEKFSRCGLKNRCRRITSPRWLSSPVGPSFPFAPARDLPPNMSLPT